MRKFLLFVLTVVAIFSAPVLTISAAEGAQPGTFTISKISGTVYYNDNPAQNANVTINTGDNTKTQTNEKGYYEFKGISNITAPTKLTLTVEYQDNKVEHPINIVKGKTDYTVDIKISSKITISGTVYLNGDLVPKANVTLKFTSNQPKQTTRTDKDGKFSFKKILVKIGEEISLSAEKDGYKGAIDPIKITTQNINVPAKFSNKAIKLSSGTFINPNISGKVINKSGQALAGIKVTINTDGQKWTTTDSNGVYTLTQVKVMPEQTKLTFTDEKKKYYTWKHDLDVTFYNATSAIKVADITMSESSNAGTETQTTLSGTVNADGKGLADVTVTISTDTDKRAITDAAGKFTLTNAKVKIGKGATVLNFKKDGYETQTYPVDVQGGNGTTLIKDITVAMKQGAAEVDADVVEPEIVQTEPDSEKIKKAEEAEAKYKAAAEKEKAGRAHSAIATGLSTAGGYMLGEAIAERIADNDAEEAMNDYLAGMRCSYAGGQNVELGQTVEIPGGDELFNYYNKYKQIAERLKRTKAALNLPAGIESQVVYDKAETNLYKYTTLGARSGGEISLARALTDPNSEDAAAWAAQKEKTNTNMTIGGGLATSGLATGIIGRIAVNNKYDDDDDESEE